MLLLILILCVCYIVSNLADNLKLYFGSTESDDKRNFTRTPNVANYN